MVLKLRVASPPSIPLFENDVEMYGAQTSSLPTVEELQFENDVEMYGAQTGTAIQQSWSRFENDVEMYGAQTFS